MAMIKFEDEKDLQRRICKILNEFGYHFEKGHDNYFCDIYDPMIKCYCEVKINGKFAPQQLLYGLAKEGIKDAQYIALANEYEIRIYTPPKFEDIIAFAQRISKDLSVSPSSVTSKRFIDEAFNLLGTQFQIYTYNEEFKIDAKHPCIFLNNTNYEYFQMIMQKYRIDPAKFINTFAKTWVTKSRLLIKNDNVTIADLESGNEVKAFRQITNKFDRQLIQSTRIKAEDIEKIIHRIDELAPIDVRRKRGKYWTKTDVSEVAEELIREYVNPTFIFEPFVGGGSLVREFVDNCKGLVNDIDGSSVDLLEKEWEGYEWKFKHENLLTTPQRTINEDWGLPKVGDTERFLVYSNPPFGTSSTNSLSSSKKETETMISKKTSSRKNEIQYGSDKNESDYFINKYGKGDLSISAIARMIEAIKNRGDGYLAFFSPLGIILGRSRYNKLLKALLRDFEFLHGEAFSGSMFNGVSKNKPISLTIWKYKKGCNTNHESLKIYKDEIEFNLKIAPLLKDGWKYDTRAIIKNEIAAQHNETLNSAPPKMIHIDLQKGGSELIPENVQIEIGIKQIPDELIYGLWSLCVGNRSLTSYSFIFDNCYTHLPDFTKKGSIEILAYATISTIITEIMGNYCQEKIGFIGMSRVFKFGGERLTKGAQYLIDTYKDCPIGKDYTIGSVFNRLKEGEDPDTIDKKLRIMIRSEIEARLNAIGYWDYLPIPDIYADEKKKVKSTDLKEFIK